MQSRLRKNGVGYLFFEFYNGAMSTLQCKRLEAAIYEARQGPTKILVFMGGVNFWSNGFHLNVIEAAGFCSRILEQHQRH